MKLEYASGPLIGLRVDIGGAAEIGRDKANKMSLSDPAVSKKHCILRSRAGVMWLRDLGSLNGTYVNDKKAGYVRLREGDVIRVGDTSLIVHSRADASARVSPLHGIAGAVRRAGRALSCGATRNPGQSPRLPLNLKRLFAGLCAAGAVVFILLCRQHAHGISRSGGLPVGRGGAFSPRSGVASRAGIPDAEAHGGLVQSNKKPASPFTPLNRPGSFVTAFLPLARFAWIATEDRGLWRLDRSKDSEMAAAWRQFTTKDGLPDSYIYAIAEDARGRIWVGTARHGVSVFNGQRWQTYGILEGCIGEHVTAIAADQDITRGDVWIGTDHGLVRYSVNRSAPAREGEMTAETAVSASSHSAAGAGGLPRTDDSTDTWHVYTRQDGLPSDQISAVAVDDVTARVWVGFDCDGIAWSDPPYTRWTALRTSKERSGDGCDAFCTQYETLAPGLPSNLINGLTILNDSRLAVATGYGLALVDARGELRANPDITSWQGLARSKTWKHGDMPHSDAYLNCIESVTQDTSGFLWLATRHMGLVRLDPATWQTRIIGKDRQSGLPGDYVRLVAADPGGTLWCGTYGGGLARLHKASPRLWPAEAGSSAPLLPVLDGSGVAGRLDLEVKQSERVLPFPTPAAAPTAQEMKEFCAEIAAVPYEPAKYPFALVYGDDWRTRGDWQGRYGEDGAVLCSFFRPEDMQAAGRSITYHRYLGGYHAKNDSLRHWTHWLFTDNPNSLEIPALYLSSLVASRRTAPAKDRRQCEWDDHGETYPMTLDGPNTSFDVWAPEAITLMSLYFFNKDGNSGRNRYRDYRIIMKQKQGEPAFDRYSITAAEQADLDRQPVLAQARVRDFRNGVYKQFLVAGPGWYTVEVRRNHSFNTIISGVFMDAMGPQRKKGPLSVAAAVHVQLASRNPAWAACRGRPLLAQTYRYYAARALQNRETPASALVCARELEIICRQLQMFNEWEIMCEALRGESPRSALCALKNGTATLALLNGDRQGGRP